MERITLAAPAKINLSLRILGKRYDGYHELETLMVPLRLADELEIGHVGGEGIVLTCSDPDLPAGHDNLCVKAAEAFLQATGLRHGISLTLLKRIPHGAGLGGGSSDAAAVLRGLNALFDYPMVAEELHQIAAPLGSDVPFFLHGGPAWCRGRGDIMEPLPNPEALPERTLLLIKPPFPVPTPWAYMRYAELRERPASGFNEPPQQIGDFVISNDLERPVFEKYILLPVMKEWLRRQEAVESAFMTGSGSTMVAVIRPDARVGSVAGLRDKIASEFGSTFWMHETGFVSCPDSQEVG